MARKIVRLSAKELAGLRRSFEKVLRRHPGAVARIFGSRAKAGSGGDLDLLISLARRPRDPLTLKLRLKQAVEDALGERKIDVVIEHPRARVDAFVRLARREGVVLWNHPRKS
ncbi:MAG: nucleotidyltransferase domain-containing protein [Elusimicrobia bacterium]|nr:nucleotidyltransferase domain-containing protein [Elusimicrobiota bacterium]